MKEAVGSLEPSLIESLLFIFFTLNGYGCLLNSDWLELRLVRAQTCI